MACLDSIVTLGLSPDADASLSGLTLMMAAGISPKNLASIATEKNVTGASLAMEKKELSLIQVKNDFIGALQANKVVTIQSNPIYDTSVFEPNTNMGLYSGERGVVLHRNTSHRGRLRTTYIKAIQVYPLSSGDGNIKIIQGNTEYTYAVTFVADEVNTFDADSLSGFPFALSNDYQGVKVLIDNTDIDFASAYITCKKGCNGSVPNPCGWADGWNGTGYVKSEGYGINVQFYCECDYTQIMCDMSKSFMGELIWLKWQINVYEEHLKSNRFEHWVIYNHEEIRQFGLPDLYGKYNAKWQDLMNGVYGILQTYRDDCLNCRNIRWQTNV